MSITLAQAEPTFGPIPSSFPRDPLLFSMYLEHMAVGQVLDTLVVSDRNGNVTPGLAKSWSVKDGGKTIVFRLREDLKFSNGTPLTSIDIVYSINRHRLDKISQSYPLLANISELIAEEGSVEVHLKRPQVAIFKILSRDQIGVVPNHWSFNASSAEPIIGSGPYRLLKTNDKWYYLKNEHYRDLTEISIPKWQLVFAPENNSSLKTLPDYVPFLRKDSLDNYRQQSLTGNFETRDFLSFVQNSAWWYPHGPHYKSSKQRKLKMAVIRQLLKKRASELGARRATGLIPFGVSGYLPHEVHFSDVTKNDFDQAAQKDKSIKILTIVLPAHLKKEIFAGDEKSELEKQFGISVQLFEPDPKTQKVPSGIHPDIVIDRWAGGFNDPEGFLPIITDVINMSIEQYLESDYPAFLDASTDIDWTRRSDKFRRFNELLVKEERLVPGWKTPIYLLLKKGLSEKELKSYRYTPRLIDIMPE